MRRLTRTTIMAGLAAVAGCSGALNMIDAPAALGAEPVEVTVRAQRPIQKVEVGIYGHFLEHIFNSVHGGLWGDQILNGTLELRPTPVGRGATGGAQGSVGGAGPATPAPRNWEFVGSAGEVRNDSDNPLNAASSVRIQPAAGGDSPTGPGIRQQNIALQQGQRYTLTLYARGTGSLVADFSAGNEPILSRNITGLTAQWQKFTVEFTAPRSVTNAALTIGSPPGGMVNVDQISLFSAAAIANHNLRPDLYQAIADLKPASIRWPGGSFANNYVWQNAIGPAEKRLPHPVEQWNDRDTYQFGTDEFIQMCERLGAEAILVLNTGRGLQDALNWLEYCMGDETTEYGKLRASNGRREPYKLNILEIDNEPWLLMAYPRYLEIVREFCPAIRAKYPNLKLSVAGSYAFDTGPGEGRAEWNNANWDPRMIADAAGVCDILSPHYYNGLLGEHRADYRDDPWNYGEFLQGRHELIKKSANPNMKIYVSEWNLTNGPNNWRMGLYAAGILNEFERRAEFITMACPALFLRKAGVTRSWDNALINFDQSRWFGAGNYVVNKLWRDSYAPGLLAVEAGGKGPEGARPLSIVATKSEDGATVFVKVMNPESTPTQLTVALDGFAAGGATMQLIAPGSETARNSLEEPDVIKAIDAPVARQGNRVVVTMPAWSAGVIKITRSR